VNRQPGFSFDSALCLAAATALGGSPASFASSSIMSSKALVEIEHVFRKSRRQLAELHVDFGQPHLPRRIELRALTAEVIERFLQESGARSGEMSPLIGCGVILQGLPKTFMHQECRT
jgi:hypothetical protein